MLVPLEEATSPQCGGKAAALAVLLRAGIRVPDGFVVTDSGARRAHRRPGSLEPAIAAALERMGDPVVAVRSSARHEDGPDASAAGQYTSVVGVRGAAGVCRAIARCRASAASPAVAQYWRGVGSAAAVAAGMAVLVQRLVDADAAGAMFTSGISGGTTRIEASWGIGTSVVGGLVTPDTYETTAAGPVDVQVGTKRTRADRDGTCSAVVDRPVAPAAVAARVLDDDTLVALTRLGERVAQLRGSPQDIEWALARGELWVLQARPVTARLPAARPSRGPAGRVITGRPGAPGAVTGRARQVHGPADFGNVRPGEILICPTTDPAWTPLLAVAGGVVTEVGGALSHAAIVAREHQIPAVLGVPEVMTRVADGSAVALDGAAGTITLLGIV